MCVQTHWNRSGWSIVRIETDDCDSVWVSEWMNWAGKRVWAHISVYIHELGPAATPYNAYECGRAHKIAWADILKHQRANSCTHTDTSMRAISLYLLLNRSSVPFNSIPHLIFDDSVFFFVHFLFYFIAITFTAEYSTRCIRIEKRFFLCHSSVTIAFGRIFRSV